MPDHMPDFRIVIAGKQLDIDPRHLTRLTVEESLEETSKCEIGVSDSHAFTLRAADVKLDSLLEVYLGYQGDLVKVFAGDIMTIEPAFAREDPPSLKIVAYDPSVRLKRALWQRSFITGDEGAPLSLYQVARKMVNDPASKYGLEFVASPKEALANYVPDESAPFNQDKQTDWEALGTIADMADYNLFVRFGFGGDDPSRFYVYLVDDNYLLTAQTMHYRMIYNMAAEDEGAMDTVRLLQFTPRIEMAGQRGSIFLSSWATGKVDPVFGKKSLADLAKADLLECATAIEKYMDRTYRLDRENKPEDTAQARMIAGAELRRRIKNLVVGDAVVMGNPRIQIGQEHQFILNGLGDFGAQFSGSYLIKRVNHSLNPDVGYITTFDVRRAGL